jgi:predicted aspartyl protease
MTPRDVMIAALAVLSVFGAARADDAPKPQACAMTPLASLDAVTNPAGMILVPATIDGHTGGMLVDTGGLAGVIGWGTASQLKNAPYIPDFGATLVGGFEINAGVTVEHFALGPLTFDNVGFLVAPDRMMHGDQIGILQPRAITSLNYEIDFVKGKLNLFHQGACPDRDVYWTQGSFAKVPMELDRRGHIHVAAVLDGKPISALIDTGAQTTTMSLATAQKIFNIDAKNPALKSLGGVNVNNLVAASVFRYPFASLTFAGIAIDRPNVVIMDSGADTNEAEMIVGIGVLRQFHIFIAYDEKALYLTPAEAH